MPTPVVGDTVLHRDRAFEIRDFPPKLGLPDGAAYEAARVMDAEDEAAWEATHLKELLASHQARYGRPPDETEAATIAERAKLRPVEPRLQRDALRQAAALRHQAATEDRPLTPEEQAEHDRIVSEGMVVPPRLMRLSGLVADLKVMSPGLWAVKTAADIKKEQEAANG